MIAETLNHAITLESALLAALSAVTTGLIWAVNQLYSRLLIAEKEVKECKDELEDLQHKLGRAETKVEMFEQCPKKHTGDCPFYSKPLVTGL